MRLEFHPAAVLEFEQAVLFYQKRGKTLGRRFSQEVQTALAKIQATPERWRILEFGVRRCFVRVFPYLILYSIEPGCILIVAIAHGRRQPGYWRQRVLK